MTTCALAGGVPVGQASGLPLDVSRRRRAASSPAVPCLVIEPMLVARLHVDLLRVSSAGCRRSR
ncbi:putative leader peptide [Frankia sp. CcWB3]